MPYFVYILKCEDGTLYTGITTDTARRFSEHKSGKGAQYTRAHKPKKIVFQEVHPNRSSASKREAELKRLKKAQKIFLIKHRSVFNAK